MMSDSFTKEEMKKIDEVFELLGNLLWTACNSNRKETVKLAKETGRKIVTVLEG